MKAFERFCLKSHCSPCNTSGWGCHLLSVVQETVDDLLEVIIQKHDMTRTCSNGFFQDSHYDHIVRMENPVTWKSCNENIVTMVPQVIWYSGHFLRIAIATQLESITIVIHISEGLCITNWSTEVDGFPCPSSRQSLKFRLLPLCHPSLSGI